MINIHPLNLLALPFSPLLKGLYITFVLKASFGYHFFDSICVVLVNGSLRHEVQLHALNRADVPPPALHYLHPQLKTKEGLQSFKGRSNSLCLHSHFSKYKLNSIQQPSCLIWVHNENRIFLYTHTTSHALYCTICYFLSME